MPILPKLREVFLGDPLREPVPESHCVSRWIPVPGARMLVDGPRAIKRLAEQVRFLDQGASIELEDVDLEPR